MIKKQTHTLLFILNSLMILTACSKKIPLTQGAATLTLVNTIVNGQPMILSSNVQVVNNNTFAHVGLVPGTTNLFIFPVGDSLQPYYKSSKPLQVQEGDIYTLLLSGSVSSPEALLLHETLPPHTDSTMGVRFINLSPGSPIVNITLSTNPMLNEFSEVGYQHVTPFHSYSVTSDQKTYRFQVREATTSALITSVTLTGTNLTTGLPRFKNVTLILRDLVGGSPAAGITRINHY